MKDRKDIEKKLVQVRFRHLKRALRTGLSRKPENCAFNAKLGKGSKPDSPRVGVCMYKVDLGAGPKGVCDECFGGRNRAADCKDFEPRQDASDIRKDFESFLQTATKGEIAYHYPDMAALLWTLGDHPVLEDIIPDDELVSLEYAEDIAKEEEQALVELPKTSWWGQLWQRIREVLGG